jgi:tRNA (Thr-GGU) A37 N-methylase
MLRSAGRGIRAGTRHGRPSASFAQRAKDRPNRLGTTIAGVVRREGARLHVRGLDAVDGTPVVDIKPVMAEVLPRDAATQPACARQLMLGYWDGRQNTHE